MLVGKPILLSVCTIVPVLSSYKTYENGDDIELFVTTIWPLLAIPHAVLVETVDALKQPSTLTLIVISAFIPPELSFTIKT